VPQIPLGELTALPKLLAAFKRPTSDRREREGRGRNEGERRGGNGREGRRGEGLAYNCHLGPRTT